MIPASIKQLVGSEKGLVLADQVVVSGSAFITNLLLAHALGLAAYGQFSAVILSQLFLLSVQQAVGSGIYQVVFPGLSETEQQRYTNGLFWLQLGWLIGLMVLSGLIYSLLPTRVIPFSIHVLLPAVVGTGLYLLQDFLRKVLLVQQRAGHALLLDCLTNVGQLALLAVFNWQHALSLPVSLWIIGATFVPSIVLGIVWLRAGQPQATNGQFVWEKHRQQGGWMLLSALTQWLAGNFFIVAGGWWLGAAALGALRLAQYIFGLLNVLLQALESYVIPRAAQVAHLPLNLLTYLRAVLLKSLLGLLPVLLFLTLGAEPLLAYMGGNDYRPFSYVMYGLSAVYMLVVCSYPIRIILRVRLLNKHYFTGYALTTVFSLATAFWLITTWGLVGVLVGLFSTQVILITYWLFVVHHNGLFVWKSFILFSVRPIRPE
ncbi:hypothetical protein [Fibrella forsythiae]|uniref:Polysaccharide biosynthesis protein n=1 Tax=Fibrella forsythiae TaxID=2817061 RepID=A0ABS3JHZ8_9BACT|nr:hypothetical protein [Fibrella forsythiae]MBO0949641.1 hypothetical protein [Fibrella forsythiae]